PVKEQQSTAVADYDIVGPVCESGDFIGLNRSLAIEENDLLAALSSGAYGFCMSSNYNSRPRAAEIMIDDDQMIEIRKRETIEELMAGESLL
ncbi:MAG: diaminopimelate decarboxylase, partial [Planctomycetota bacterium]